MNIEDIEIVLIDQHQSILTDEGYFQCGACAIEQNRIIFSNRDIENIEEFSLLVNHEFLHIILEELFNLETSIGIDNISTWNIYPMDKYI